MQHRAKKHFGQNFLVDDTVIERIIDSIRPEHDDRVVEIGPGPGALTQPLLDRLDHLDVIELDRDIVPGLSRLAASEKLSIHNQDVLSFDFTGLARKSGGSLRVVGNLPYNISTAVLFHLLAVRDRIRDMHFMLQKEVVERIAAGSGTSNYGRLSVMMQLYFHVTPLFTVPPACFSPPPKVDSAVIRLVPVAQPPISAAEQAEFENFVRQSFSQRRKTLRNTLKPLFPHGCPQVPGIDFSRRPQELGVREYVQLFKTIR